VSLTLAPFCGPSTIVRVIVPGIVKRPVAVAVCVRVAVSVGDTVPVVTVSVGKGVNISLSGSEKVGPVSVGSGINVSPSGSEKVGPVLVAVGLMTVTEVVGVGSIALTLEVERRTPPAASIITLAAWIFLVIRIASPISG
jgi:hypothetical protein